jgi:transposase
VDETRAYMVAVETVSVIDTLANQVAALALFNSKSALGAYLRRQRSRLGAPKAITATAHKLARIIYHLVKERKPFDETVFAEHEKIHQERFKKRILRQAKSFGLQIVEA